MLERLDNVVIRACLHADDEIFVTLMSAHHQGGVHMAEQAADAAGVDDVRLMARQIAEGQRHEIDEMNTLLARSAA